MKKMSFFNTSATLLVLFSCTNAPESDQATTTEAQTVQTPVAGEAWKVDSNASKLEWVATKVTGYHTGTVPIKNGELNMSNNQLVGGRFVLDMANMVVSGPSGSKAADNNKLLGHLKSPDFFDVSNHPEASFVITGIKPFSGTVQDTTDPRQEEISEYKVLNPTHTISGNLTIKGITKNIEFPAKITISDNHLEALAKFNIDRQQWNITYPGQPDDLIRDEIHFGIALKGTK